MILSDPERRLLLDVTFYYGLMDANVSRELKDELVSLGYPDFECIHYRASFNALNQVLWQACCDTSYDQPVILEDKGDWEWLRVALSHYMWIPNQHPANVQADLLAKLRRDAKLP